MGSELQQGVYALIPALAYLIVSSLTALLCGPDSDVCLRVLIGALIMIGVDIFLYRRQDAPGKQVLQSGADGGRQVQEMTQAAGGLRTANVRSAWLLRLGLCVAAFAAGGLCSYLAGVVMSALHLDRIFSNATQELMLRSPLWLQILGPGLSAAAAEELTYRGLVCSRLRKCLSHVAAAILTSLLFAAGHGNMIQALYAFPMALLLQQLRHLSETETGRRLQVITHPAGVLIWEICFHAGANLLTITLQALP